MVVRLRKMGEGPPKTRESSHSNCAKGLVQLQQDQFIVEIKAEIKRRCNEKSVEVAKVIKIFRKNKT